MKSLKNNVQLIGNLGNDVEFSTTKTNTSLAKFSLATNDTYKDKDGNKQTKTEWHSVIAWGKTAELANNFLSKGDEIALNGKLVYNTYEKDGVTFKNAQIEVDELLFINTKGKPESDEE